MPFDSLLDQLRDITARARHIGRLDWKSDPPRAVTKTPSCVCAIAVRVTAALIFAIRIGAAALIASLP